MVRRIVRIAAYAALFAAVAGISAILSMRYAGTLHNRPLQLAWNETGGTVIADAGYPNDYGNAYDLYLPEDTSAHEAHYLILYIHGGGFTGGSKAEGRDWCRFMAEKGYVAASMDYTVSNGEHPSNIPLMNSEIESCVEAIFQECSARGIRLEGMAPTGESAGGCLALLYAYTQPADAPVPVKFVFEETGPVYFGPEEWGSTDAQQSADFVSLMTGEDVTPDMVEDGSAQELVDAISPSSQVIEDTVPTICAYGLKDKVIPVGLKYRLIDALDAKCVPHEYFEFPNSNHFMYGDLGLQDRYVATVLEYAQRYF